jgi:hypothetical protein
MDQLEEIRQMAVDTGSDDQQHIRDLSKYIVTQSQLQSEPIPKRKFLLGEWMPEDSFGMVYAPVVLVNRGSVWQWLLQ